jgi:CDP-paratose 2-epimerase
MSIVVITGSSGLVGSESVKFFANKGFDVIGIDNNDRKLFFGNNGDTNWLKNNLLKNFKKFTHYNTNIESYDSLKKIFKRYKKEIKIIIHSAAQPSHDWAYQNPIKDFKVNALGTLNILELYKIYCPNASFIHMSTNKIYGDNPNKLEFIETKTRWEVPKNQKFYNGIDESMSIDNCTHSLFGVSKAYGDLLVQEYGKNFKLKTVVFRGGCITGPNHSGAKLHGFLSYLVKSCIENKSYEFLGYKGKQVRDNLHSSDLIKAFWEFFNKPCKEGNVYNIGGSRYSNCSIIEAINLVKKKLNINIKIKVSKTPRTGDHQWYISNINKFTTDYPNFKIKYNTEKIIEELI